MAENILIGKLDETEKKFLFFMIDDDADDREFFSFALAKTDYNVDYSTAKDGEDALKYLEKNKDFVPNFIFLNLNMPRVNGIECLAEMRKINRLKNVPIYIYSTSILDKDKAETLKLGANDHIIKPSSLKRLTEILSNVISTGKLSKGYL